MLYEQFNTMHMSHELKACYMIWSCDGYVKLGMELRRVQMSSRRNHLSSRCVWLAHFLLRRAQVHVSFLIACFYCKNFQNVLFNPSDFHFVTPTLFSSSSFGVMDPIRPLRNSKYIYLFFLWETCVHLNVYGLV